MPTFKPGEIVNVTITDARVASDDGRTVEVTYGHGKYLIPLADDTVNVTIERTDTTPRTFAAPEEPTDVTAVRDRTGRLWVCPGRPGDNLWWLNKLGYGIGYEWHQILQFGPLTAVDGAEVQA